MQTYNVVGYADNKGKAKRTGQGTYTVDCIVAILHGDGRNARTIGPTVNAKEIKQEWKDANNLKLVGQ